MIYFPKGAKFPKTSSVAKALKVSKFFVSRVVHGKATSKRVADYIYQTYQVRLRGYKYEK